MDERDRKLVQELVLAYRDGAFPMNDPETGEIGFYDPDPRAILPLAPEDGWHVPRRLHAQIRQQKFLLTTDKAFSDVVAACAAPRVPRPGSRSVSAETWIDGRLQYAYQRLFEAGHAHSVEAWVPTDAGPELVGGIFGVHVGGFFAGESMFSRPERGGTNASKICLVTLANHLRARGFTLFDVQFHNPHLEQFGVRLVRRKHYRDLLARAVAQDVQWGSL